jgi:hypothetical protein
LEFKALALARFLAPKAEALDSKISANSFHSFEKLRNKRMEQISLIPWDRITSRLSFGLGG